MSEITMSAVGTSTASSSDELVAAVDLGSNSFRMVIAKLIHSESGTQLQAIDTLRDPVRLAAGLKENKTLDQKSFSRGLEAIRRFGDRLKNFHPSQVRAVATNTLRVARNADDPKQTVGWVSYAHPVAKNVAVTVGLSRSGETIKERGISAGVSFGF